MATNKQTLWLEIRADDKASGSIAAIGDTVKKLPESFSKASGAITAVGGAVGSFNGKAGEMVGKLTGVAGMVATGGPVGLGVAALSVGVTLLSEAWDRHNESVRRTAEFMQAGEDMIRKNQEAIGKLEDQIKNFGKSALETELAQLEQVSAAQRKSIASDEAALKSKKNLKQGWGEIVAVGDELNDSVADNRTITADTLQQDKYMLGQTEQRIAQIQQLLAMQAAKKAADDAAADAARNTADANREAQRAERERAAEIERILAKRAEREEDVQKSITDLLKQHEDQRLAIAIHAANSQAEANDKAAQKIKADQEDKSRDATSLAQNVSDAWGSAVASIITGQATAGEAMRQAAIQTANIVITTAAARAAAEAFADRAWIPGIGLAVGGAAAAAAFAAVMAYATKFATGGTVQGGIAGRDSVPALLMPGEEVLPVGEAQRYRASRARGGDGASGATVVVNLPVSQVVTDRASLAKAIRGELGRALRDGFSDGSLRVPRMAVV